MRVTITNFKNEVVFAGPISNAEAYVLATALGVKKVAENKYPDYNSLHEAYGKLAEEFHELQEQVFVKEANRSKHVVDAELADIVVVCLRSANVDIRK